MKPKEVKAKETKTIEYDDFYIDKIAEMRDLSKRFDFNNLTYIYKGKSAPINLISFKGPLRIFKSIYNGDKALEDVEKDQKKLKSNFKSHKSRA